MMPLVNLRQLEYLTALAVERHFGRAADACHVSQPALSSAIRKLEQELGVTLVRRAQRYDALTPEGEVLVGWAQRIVSDVDSLRDEAGRLRGSLTGRLRLGVIPTAMPATALITENLLRRQPGISLDVRMMSSVELVRRLAAHELDGGITYIDDEPLGAALTMPLYEERYFLLARRRQLGRHRATIGWAELAGEPLCLLTTDMQNRRLVDAALTRAGVAATPRVEADDIMALLAFAQAGYPCVIAHPWLALEGIPRGMSAVALEAPVVTHAIGLVTLPLEPTSPMVRALRAELASAEIANALSRATEQLTQRA